MNEKLAVRYTAVDDLGRATSGKGRVTPEQLAQIDAILAGQAAAAGALAEVTKAVQDQAATWATEMHRWLRDNADLKAEVAELRRRLADLAVGL